MVVSQITPNVFFGVVGDIKPAAGLVENTLYFELDSGDIYKYVGGVWSLFASKSKQEILTNKTLITPTIASILNNGALLTLPTIASTLIGRNTPDILTNKTLTQPTIATIYNGGILTLPTGTMNIVGTNSSDILTNKIFNINSNLLIAAGLAAGDILVSNGTSFIRLARGTSGYVLTSGASTVSWAAPTGGSGSGGASLTTANTWSAIQTYLDTMLALRNPGNTASLTILAGAQTGAISVTFPVLTGNDVFQLLTATQTPSNKTINLTNNTVTDTSAAIGDIIKHNGTRFVRLAKGTANQILAVNSGATDIAWTSLNSERTGTATASGNGSAVTFTIAHGLGSVPYMALIQCSSHALDFTYTYDATNITVVFASAPPSGTNNVIFQWRVVA
jgi:hypothetical protein